MADVIVGSRGSRLALKQTQDVIDALELAHPELKCSLRVIRTSGDRMAQASLKDVGTQGLFVKEIELALLRGEIDLAVHSAKDMPTRMDDHLCIAAHMQRLDPSDALVSAKGALKELPAGSTIGTGSPRRRAQLLAARPDLNVVPVRGNLDTRIRKLADGQFDAIVVACAGLMRLGRDAEITQILPWDICVPAAGQGALAVQCRKDSALMSSLASLDDADTRRCLEAERQLLSELNVGCQTPFGAVASQDGSTMRLAAFVGDYDGQVVIRACGEGDPASPQAVAHKTASELLDQGAEQILEQVRSKDTQGTEQVSG